MNKEFIDYTEALALKELGFNEDCFGYYNNHEPKRGPRGLVISGYQDHNEETEGDDLICSAPTYSQAFRFFREKHKLIHNVHTMYTSKKNWECSICDIAGESSFWDTVVKGDYEEAEVKCLRKLIEIVMPENK